MVHFLTSTQTLQHQETWITKIHQSGTTDVKKKRFFLFVHIDYRWHRHVFYWFNIHVCLFFLFFIASLLEFMSAINAATMCLLGLLLLLDNVSISVSILLLKNTHRQRYQQHTCLKEIYFRCPNTTIQQKCFLYKEWLKISLQN